MQINEATLNHMDHGDALIGFLFEGEMFLKVSGIIQIMGNPCMHFITYHLRGGRQ